MLRLFDGPAWRSLLTTLHLPEDLPEWRPAFWLAGLIGMVWCLAFYWWFRDDPAKSPSVNAAELQLIKGVGVGEGKDRGLVSHHMPRAAWRALVACRSLWAMGLVYLFGSFAWSFFASWMPRYLQTEHRIEFGNSEWMAACRSFAAA